MRVSTGRSNPQLAKFKMSSETQTFQDLYEDEKRRNIMLKKKIAMLEADLEREKAVMRTLRKNVQDCLDRLRKNFGLSRKEPKPIGQDTEVQVFRSPSISPRPSPRSRKVPKPPAELEIVRLKERQTLYSLAP